MDPIDDLPPDELPPDDLPARVRAALTGPSRPDGPVARVLRELGWSPPPQDRRRLPEAGDLLDLLAGGCSVHEAAARLDVPLEALRAELVALRCEHACASTAAVVRRTRGGH